MGAKVTALERSRRRAEFLVRNLGRLTLDAEIVVADALGVAAPAPFDAVLLDAPCTATGTIRRHPDVPWAKSPADVERLAEAQARLFEAAVGARSLAGAGLRRVLAAARGRARSGSRPCSRATRPSCATRSPGPSSRACRSTSRPRARCAPALPPRGLGRARRLLHRQAQPRRLTTARTPGRERDALRPIRRALLSVHDKTGLVELGRRCRARRGAGLDRRHRRGLREAGVAAVEVSDVTGFAEILDGGSRRFTRASTAASWPAATAGIWRRSRSTVAPIDLVVVNLYPFEATIASGADFAACIEQIDVGGPA